VLRCFATNLCRCCCVLSLCWGSLCCVCVCVCVCDLLYAVCCVTRETLSSFSVSVVNQPSTWTTWLLSCLLCACYLNQLPEGKPSSKLPKVSLSLVNQPSTLRYQHTKHTHRQQQQQHTWPMNSSQTNSTHFLNKTTKKQTSTQNK